MENLPESLIEGLNLTTIQKEVIKCLSELTFTTQNLAEMYIGALKALLNKSNPERIYQCAHSLREFGKHLVDHIESISKTGEEHKVKMNVLISQVDELGGPPKDFFVSQYIKLHKYFIDVCHHRIHPTEKELQNNILKLEYTLLGLFGPVYESMDELDKIIEIESPTKDDFEKMISIIKKLTHYRYFFGKIYHPDWLKYLKKPFFSEIPKRNFYWPESKFLIKISDKKPDEVAEIIKNLSSTENIGVQLDFLDALLIMPIKYSKNFIKQIKRWLGRSSKFFINLSRKIVKFMIILAENEELDLVFELAGALFFIKKYKKVYVNQEKIDYIKRPPEQNEEMDAHMFKQFINELMPIFKEKTPVKAIEFYAKRLKIAISHDLEGLNLKDEEDDWSNYWCRSIVEEVSYSLSNKNVFVNAIRTLLIYIGNERRDLFVQAVKILNNYNFLIFRRLELFAFNNFPKISKDFIIRAILNEKFLNKIDKMFEYYNLLKNEYPNVGKDVQNKYLNMVDKGPGEHLIENYKNNFKNWYKIEPNQEEIDSFVQDWQIQRLIPIKNILSQEIIEKYNVTDENVARIDLFKKKISEIEAESKIPKVEQFQLLTAEEILSYLKNYNEFLGWFDDSIEKIGRNLEVIVLSKPEEFTEISSQFYEVKFLKPNLASSCISHLLRAFQKVIKDGKKFNWEPVLLLCEKIVKSNLINVHLSEVKEFNFENNLNEIKNNIGRLLIIGLENAENSIPFTLKDSIWFLLKTLTQDKDPSWDTELEYIKGGYRLIDIPINTVRGEAINGIIQYAIWHRTNKSNGGNDFKEIESKMPQEVKNILEKHLNFEIEPNFSIRSLYGQNFNRLIYLEKNWVIENLEEIFPLIENKQEYWEASWSSYLFFNQCYEETFKLIREHYIRAIDLIIDSELNIKRFPFNVDKLAQHLMQLYIAGVEELTIENSLVKKFFEKTPVDIRKIAIHYIGLNLQQINQLEDIDIIKVRLKNLWEYRISEANKSENKDFLEELKYFESWFENSIFDKEWVLTKFEETLNLIEGSIFPFYDALDKLLDFIDKFPLKSINCMKIIIQNELKRDNYLMFVEKYRTLFQKVLSSQNEEAKKIARNLINYLGERDVHHFRDLL